MRRELKDALKVLAVYCHEQKGDCKNCQLSEICRDLENGNGPAALYEQYFGVI